MAKQLILVRHAKAEWTIRGFSDHERTLSAYGWEEIQDVSNRDRILQLKPTVIVTSDAVRAHSTALKFQLNWHKMSAQQNEIEPNIESRIEPAVGSAIEPAVGSAIVSEEGSAIKPAVGSTIELKIEPKIYEASLKQLWEIVLQLPQEANSVAMFGHNPGFTALAVSLGQIKLADFPTCGVIVFDFDIDQWADLEPHMGKLLFYDFPQP